MSIFKPSNLHLQTNEHLKYNHDLYNSVRSLTNEVALLLMLKLTEKELTNLGCRLDDASQSKIRSNRKQEQELAVSAFNFYIHFHSCLTLL